jgi:formylglycine-generating enzyme
MMFGKTPLTGLLAAAVVASVVAAQAVTIDLVLVGNAGNAPDTRYYSDYNMAIGAVAYEYAIGKYETTAGQYCEFLNAVAATDTYSLYSTNMYSSSDGCGIRRLGVSGSYTYQTDALWVDRPVNFVSWGDAARFVNWLHNGQRTGPQGLATTEDGAYYLNGTMSGLMAVTRKTDAKWWIPSEDEWYKAAYHDKTAGLAEWYYDYPTASDTAPINTLPDPGNHANYYDIFHMGTGKYTLSVPPYTTPVGAFENSSSPYGTFDQGGNVWEWNDTAYIAGISRALRGGSFTTDFGNLAASYRCHGYPTGDGSDVGFRVAASVPEPGSFALLLAGGVSLLAYAWRRWKPRA